MCFGPGRLKTKLNSKQKLGSLPRESKIMTGAYCFSLALHHQQHDMVQVAVRWHCTQGYSEDFTWGGITEMFILIFCNIKKPPWEPSRDLVIWKVAGLSGIPESWKRSCLLPSRWVFSVHLIPAGGLGSVAFFLLFCCFRWKQNTDVILSTVVGLDYF